MLVTRSDIRVLEIVGLTAVLTVLMLLAGGCGAETGKLEKTLGSSAGSPREAASRGLQSGMGSPPIDEPKSEEVPTKSGEPSQSVTNVSGPDSASPGAAGPGASPAISETTATTPSVPTTAESSQ
ncbi:MAG: hypothetical protein HYY25_02180 [Candidatus Wallbacteria bacterium]|nr:hypothetical protein [Candidatus Wallbacteria bacterium]